MSEEDTANENAPSDDRSDENDSKNRTSDEGTSGESASDEGGNELPEAVIERAVTLTRRARSAVDDNERAAYLADRDDLLAESGFRARVRDEDRAVLVLYPEEWVEDGTVCPERIENIDRGVERPLEGVGETDDWETIDAHNRDLADAVADEHGPDHGANAHALADFMGNHYSKPIESATREELELFLEEYFLRNAWPTDDQKAVVRESVRLVFEQAGEPAPIE
jgi:hypothetical protein